MIVPEYWSEARSKITHDGKQRTIVRFGWSDAGKSDAHEKAKQRVNDAIDRVRAGETVRARDHKVAYNGAEGLPIREEIIERHGEAVITRNSYGALCLNTPDVVFADIDVEMPDDPWSGWVFILIAFVAGLWLSQRWDSWLVLAGAVAIGLAFSGSFERAITRMTAPFRGDLFEPARERIEKFAISNPSWLLRLYRTPNGYRVLVMHKTFDPTDEAAFEFMQALKSDPKYVQMCRNQKCFRARISPKPWRIDIEHIRPRPGVWPIKDEWVNRRRKWVQQYEQKAADYSSCRYETTIGSGRADRRCEAIRDVHDRYCKSDQDLQIA